MDLQPTNLTGSLSLLCGVKNRYIANNRQPSSYYAGITLETAVSFVGCRHPASVVVAQLASIWQDDQLGGDGDVRLIQLCRTGKLIAIHVNDGQIKCIIA
jgi:hypothetical protein